MRRSILLLTACLAFTAISGCGNKGPLYLPSAAPRPARAKPARAPAPAPANASTAAQPASASSVVTKPLSGN